MSAHALELMYEALYLVFMLSLPPILAASVAGVLFALFQAVTQLQEQTLSFAVKLVTVCVTLMATAGWLADELLSFANEVFEVFYAY